jgi:hypothetical protein
MAKYQNDKLYQKVNNKPKKFGNNNVNSINVIVNPKDEPEHQRMPNPIVNNLMDIVPPSNADIQQIASRAAQDGRTINAEEVRNAGMQSEISEAMQQNAELINFQERYGEMEHDNEKLKEMVNNMVNVYADDAAALTEEVRKREQIILEMQQQAREVEAMREVEQELTPPIGFDNVKGFGDAGDIPSPQKKDIFKRLENIDAEWESLWGALQTGENVYDKAEDLIKQDRALMKIAEDWRDKEGIKMVRKDNEFRERIIKWYNENKKLK